MKLRAIRTDADLDWALSEIEQYFDTPPAPGTEDADRFDILADLIEAYENREYPIEALDPVETLKVFMEIKKKRPNDLAGLVGGKPRASEILKRKRPLTLRMIQNINRSWKIPASCLIAPYHLAVKGDVAECSALPAHAAQAGDVHELAGRAVGLARVAADLAREARHLGHHLSQL